MTFYESNFENRKPHIFRGRKRIFFLSKIFVGVLCFVFFRRLAVSRNAHFFNFLHALQILSSSDSGVKCA